MNKHLPVVLGAVSFVTLSVWMFGTAWFDHPPTKETAVVEMTYKGHIYILLPNPTDGTKVNGFVHAGHCACAPKESPKTIFEK